MRDQINWVHQLDLGYILNLFWSCSVRDVSWRHVLTWLTVALCVIFYNCVKSINPSLSNINFKSQWRKLQITRTYFWQLAQIHKSWFHPCVLNFTLASLTLFLAVNWHTSRSLKFAGWASGFQRHRCTQKSLLQWNSLIAPPWAVSDVRVLSRYVREPRASELRDGSWNYIIYTIREQFLAAWGHNKVWGDVELRAEEEDESKSSCEAQQWWLCVLWITLLWL